MHYRHWVRRNRGKNLKYEKSIKKPVFDVKPYVLAQKARFDNVNGTRSAGVSPPVPNPGLAGAPQVIHSPNVAAFPLHRLASRL